jgi:hypothetical protein
MVSSGKHHLPMLRGGGPSSEPIVKPGLCVLPRERGVGTPGYTHHPVLPIERGVGTPGYTHHPELAAAGAGNNIVSDFDVSAPDDVLRPLKLPRLHEVISGYEVNRVAFGESDSVSRPGEPRVASCISHTSEQGYRVSAVDRAVPLSHTVGHVVRGSGSPCEAQVSEAQVTEANLGTTVGAVGSGVSVSHSSHPVHTNLCVSNSSAIVGSAPYSDGPRVATRIGCDLELSRAVKRRRLRVKTTPGP